MVIYYIDSCIWMDYFEDRKDTKQDIGRIAFMFFQKVIREKSTIVISQTLISELSRRYPPEIIQRLFSLFHHIEYINPTKEEIQEASNRETKKLRFNDVLHAIMTRNMVAILITRDKHFKSLKNICDARKPEELLDAKFLL